MFSGFRWIETWRSKLAKIRAFKVDYFDFSCNRIEYLKLIICNSTLIVRPPSHDHKFLHLLSCFLGKKIEKGLARPGFEHTTFRLEDHNANLYTTAAYFWYQEIFNIFKYIHSCNFMIPAPLFYEVNDPLIQVCYKPWKHVAKHAHPIIYCIFHKDESLKVWWITIQNWQSYSAFVDSYSS